MDGTIFIDDDAFEQPQRRSKTRKVRRGGSAPSGASGINYPDGCDSEMDRLTWSGFPEKDRAGVRNIMGIFDIGWSEATAAYASADRDVQVAIDTLLFEADISDSDSDDESHSPVPDSILDPVLAEPETKKEEKKEEEEKAPAPAERRADGPSAPNCVVCLGPLDFGGVVKLATTKCGHVFCRGCIIKWIEQRYACPVCRKPCGKADIRDLYF